MTVSYSKKLTMVSVSTTAALPLLPILQRVFPDVTSYQIDKNIVQSNAEGFCLTAISQSTTGTKETRRDLFVKCVEATKYSNRPWADLRRTLLYSRTEARFYSEVLPLLRDVSEVSSLTTTTATATAEKKPSWGIAPQCYLAASYLEDLIDETESTAAKTQSNDSRNNNSDNRQDPKYDNNDTTILQSKGGNLILESLTQSYYQTSPLTISQAKQCISAIAKFHACAFENKDILQIVSSRLCQYGGSYHLTNRNPRELNNICQTWDEIVENLQDAPTLPSNFFEKEGFLNLGKRIQTAATYISNVLSPSFDDNYATIVHGDYKAMNVFLPLNNDNDIGEDNEPLLIDFSSVGVGLGVSDVAMHIPHAVHPNDLENGGEEELVKHYYEVFQEALPQTKEKDVSGYTYEQFLRHYKFARVDYFRFIMGRMWKGLSLEVFEKRKNLKNFAEFNRTLEAAVAFIIRVDEYLKEIEAEMKEKGIYEG